MPGIEGTQQAIQNAGCRARKQFLHPPSVNLWGVVKAMQLILELLRRFDYEGIKTIIASDCKNTIDAILTYVPRYIDVYGDNPDDWKNSNKGPLNNADSLNEAMNLLWDMEDKCGNEELEGVLLVYRRWVNNIKGFDWAQDLALRM